MIDLETCPGRPPVVLNLNLAGQMHHPHGWRLSFESPLAVVHVCAWCPAAKVVAPQGLGPIAAILEDLIRSEAARTATVLETHGLVKITSIEGSDTRHGPFDPLLIWNTPSKNFP